MCSKCQDFKGLNTGEKALSRLHSLRSLLGELTYNGKPVTSFYRVPLLGLESLIRRSDQYHDEDRTVDSGDWGDDA